MHLERRATQPRFPSFPRSLPHSSLLSISTHARISRSSRDFSDRRVRERRTMDVSELFGEGIRNESKGRIGWPRSTAAQKPTRACVIRMMGKRYRVVVLDSSNYSLRIARTSHIRESITISGLFRRAGMRARTRGSENLIFLAINLRSRYTRDPRI